jgi:membrane protein DedA with SNARE-associated domain
MTELFTLEQILTYVSAYGLVVIAAVIFLNAAGLPMPAFFMVVATGAFIRQGVIPLYVAFPVVLISVVAGDSFNYALGRFAQGWVQRRWQGNQVWQNAEQTFQARGGLAIFLSRWLLTPLAIPVNLVAGGSGYPYARFLLFDVAGEMVWLLGYGTVGYLFGNQWQVIAQAMSDVNGLLGGLTIIALGLYWMRRRQHRRRLARASA